MKMPAPITASAMKPTRYSKGSVFVYSANPPHTPPSTLLVELRRRWGCGISDAVAGGAGCQDGWSDPVGGPEDECSGAGGFGSGVPVIERRLSLSGACVHGRRSPL